MFFLLNLVVRLVFSSILHIWYVEVWISRCVVEGPFDFEIARVDCSNIVPLRSLSFSILFYSIP